MKLLINGLSGVGKNTIIDLLSSAFHLKKYSSGGIMRTEAEKAFPHYKDSLYRFEEKLTEKGDYAVDKFIDSETQRILLEEDNFILDSRLGWFFSKKMNSDAIRILLTASPDIRIGRIAKRDGVTFEEAKQYTLKREQEMKERFQLLYEVDFCELSNPYNFHFSVDTDFLEPVMVYESIKLFLKRSIVI